MLWSKQFYYYDVDRWLRRRPGAAAPPGRDATAATASGPHVQRGRHLDAGQVGVPVVRGLGPGLPRDPAGAGRPGLRQGAAPADAARAVPAPERADARPTSGTSATSTRRSTPGPLRVLQHRAAAAAARATAGSWRDVFHKLLLNFTWWVNRKDTRRARTSSRAASSGSTTSASSTAARRCRPAARSSRRTATAGWRCTARTCSSIALELAPHDSAYEDVAIKFFEHFVCDRRAP